MKGLVIPAVAGLDRGMKEHTYDKVCIMHGHLRNSKNTKVTTITGVVVVTPTPRVTSTTGVVDVRCSFYFELSVYYVIPIV